VCQDDIRVEERIKGLNVYVLELGRCLNLVGFACVCALLCIRVCVCDVKLSYFNREVIVFYII